MKFDQLQYFLEVSKTQHVGKAAKILHISPSAISHSISALEDELGHALFERFRKNIYLTLYGKKLAQRAEKVLLDLRQMREDLQSGSVEWEGRFKIGCSHGLLPKWVIPRWNKIQNAHKKIEVEFYSLRSAQVVQDVAQGELDLGICFAPTSNPFIAIEKICGERLEIAVRKGHPLLKEKPQRLAQRLSEIECASPKAFQGIEVCENYPQLKKFGVRSQVSFIFDSYDVAVSRIQSSESWCLLPSSFIRWNKLESVPLPGWKEETFIAAITPNRRPPARALRELVHSLKG